MSRNSFYSFLQNSFRLPLFVLDPSINHKNYVALDLSPKNKNLLRLNTSSSNDLGDYIFQYIKSNNAQVAYGGYNELRNIYERSDYFKKQSKEQERNIHIGLDLWIEAGTEILTPLDGKVHSFANNTNHGDYGPTIILEHNIDGYEFFTLYGHLSLESIENIQIGDNFKQGDVIATLGNSTVNGDYPPHLHFQLIKDLQGKIGDYPGVCNTKNLDYYLDNCPDPNLLLKIK